ncbi:hypothetical protein NLL38_04080 [Corynebacterium accolens]|uniref:hypothetical protein n=1 Tax=Corynebacterium accolens TaxID=38284 RepID=UPI00266EF347|nr:hypothetical protein [Corynebacterium accolens]WKS72101.1 hypothetical protein NLL38_04080 [Corynebacterium accolens]WKS74426.1 hypothetical protein NLL44_04415 [Corynebacterium accolens]
MYPLVADGGEVTVLRDLAAFSYGSWSVDWPESVPEEQRPELPDDRDFGYALKLKEPPGRMGRRFVRANVSITAQDFDNEGQPVPFSGESDVEQVLEEAAERVDGDVFFEREITRAGLGALVPRVDFDVDDVVPVLIWGKTIMSPVTSIEDVAESGAVVDYRVHVGGQLLRDDAARERANREVERTIAQERRERVESVAKERKARKAAVSAESSARRADVESVRGVLTGGGEHQRDLLASLEGLNRQLQRNGEDPAPGLIPAYVQMNTQLWQAQQEINEALRKADEAQSALVASNAEHLAELDAVNESRGQLLDELRSQERELRAQRVRWFGLKQRSDEFWSYSGSTLTAKGSWVGEAVVFVTYATEVHTGATSSPSRTEIEHTSTDYMDIGSTRSKNLNPNSRGVRLTTKGAVMYRVTPGETRELSMDRRGFSPSTASWTQVDAFNAQSTAEYVFQPRVVWDAVHRGAQYQFRVTVDGSVVLSDDSGTDFGPLFPWGDGRRERVASARRRRINAGQRVRFEVWTDAPEVSSRRVDSAVCRVSWIED